MPVWLLRSSTRSRPIYSIGPFSQKSSNWTPEKAEWGKLILAAQAFLVGVLFSLPTVALCLRLMAMPKLLGEGLSSCGLLAKHDPVVIMLLPIKLLLRRSKKPW
eukprot:TRINITY_DN2931_c0_g1_i3.p4 TRINITY_DN2931_c0_g1~~TRINITY_DN2931_c0_g1_i3.p4  ORF type:complete len:104 (-),score=4.60 TRINITY_DN2931_c0_g1_i3:124-435(-)